MESQPEVKDSFKLLLIASAITVALWFIPLAGVIIYPFGIFVTFIHEIGHALAALATFGSVKRIAVSWDGSGVAWTRDGWGFLISSAGYLGTTIYGSGLLLWLRRARHARTAALGTAVLLLSMTVLFGGNLVAWLAGLTFGFGCLLLALKVRAKFVHFFMSFLAVQSVLNAFYDLRTLMYLSAFDPNKPTDAQNMAAATGIPAIFWAVFWSALSFLILGATLVIYYRSLAARAVIAEPVSPLLISEGSHNTANRAL